MSRQANNRRLAFERCESRFLLAGDLHLVGTPRTDATVISELESGLEVLSRLDTNGDSLITGSDAEVLIDSLNRFGSRQLPDPTGELSDALDTNDDGYISPIDVLLIANQLERFRNLFVTGEYTYDDEAMALAQANSDDIFPERLASRIFEELRLIRGTVGELSEIRHRRTFSPGYLALDLTEVGRQRYRAGSFSELNGLNVQFGAQSLSGSGSTLIISFAADLNPLALATVYSSIEGVLSGSPHHAGGRAAGAAEGQRFEQVAFDVDRGVYRFQETFVRTDPRVETVGRFWEASVNGGAVTLLCNGDVTRDFPTAQIPACEILRGSSP